jgi:hypothetical protein
MVLIIKVTFNSGRPLVSKKKSLFTPQLKRDFID